MAAGLGSAVLSELGSTGLGAAVSGLLGRMIGILKDLHDKDANLQELERHLHRLEPCVEELRSGIRNQTAHPARVWLDHLEQEMKAVSELVADIRDTRRGCVSRARMLQGLEPINERICKLIDDAAVANWASMLSSLNNLTQTRAEDRVVLNNLTQSRAEDRAVLDHIRATQEQHYSRQDQNWSQLEQVRGKQKRVWKQQDQIWGKQKRVLEVVGQILEGQEILRRQIMLQAVNFQPSHLRVGEIRRAAFYTSSHESSSSADGRSYRNQAGRFDTSKPKVDFGGNKVVEDLIANLIYEHRYTKWLGFWAMGGAGKTFTAKKIFNDPRIKRHFSGGRFWITVSKDGIPARFLLQNLFEEIPESSVIPELPDTLEEWKAAVKHLLDRDNVLLVVDDAWSSEILESLDVISEERKGVILVTTRDKNILRSKRAEVIEIPPLSQDHSWQLFSWYAFSDQGRNLPSDLESIARDVAAECQGLPLALEVLGASMRNIHVYSREGKQGKSLENEWKKALERIRAANVCNEKEYEKLFGRLQLSVESLSEADDRLRDCFFDVAAFPEDCEIEVEDLLNMWIGAGSVEAEADSEVSSEDEAKYLFGLLVVKSMIELTERTSIDKLLLFDDGSCCKVHDVMRDLVRRNLKKNFKTNLMISALERKCLYASGLRMEEFPKAWSSPFRYSVEKLSLFGNNLLELPESFDAPNLRILILKRNKNLAALPPGFFRSLSSLRVLNLAETGIEVISDGVVDSLKSLVLLDARRCPRLRRISPRIKYLDTLETILLEGCSQICLTPPRHLHTLSGQFEQEVLRWPGLRNLRLECSRLSGILISSFMGLKVLELEVLDYRGTLVADIMHLCRLKVLKIYVHKGNRFELPCVHKGNMFELPCLGELPKLEVLWLELVGVQQIYFPPSFAKCGAFPSLKEMKLRSGCVEKETCHWFMFHPGTMPQIETMTISRESSLDIPEPYKSLRELSNLLSLSLRLRSAQSMDHIFSEPDCFPRLENVMVYNSSWGDHHMKLPTGVGALPRLKYVEFSTALREQCERGVDCIGYECPEPCCPHVKPPSLLELERQGKVEVKVTYLGDRSGNNCLGNLFHRSEKRG